MWNPTKKSEALAKFKSFPYPKPGTSNVLDSKEGDTRRKYFTKTHLHRLFVFVVLLLCSGYFLKHTLLTRPKESNVVMIFVNNIGGGVLDVKSPRQWELEKISTENKKKYAERHGYHFFVKSTGLKRRYAHEWRESWEKADYIMEAMKKYPHAEWFWWVDLTTFIMEPQYSLEKLIINRLDHIATRNITDSMEFNPKNFHEIPFVDYSEDINFILGQDCNGFSLGSFLVRRSDWTSRLMDFLWDPVVYGQKHMDWPHDEQNAIEYFYENNAWLRSGMGFVPLRLFNSYPPGACAGEGENPRFFYNQKEGDFLVNLAGCNYGRDCLDEINHYKGLAQRKRGWRKLVPLL
nr:unnamed protein product [Schizosaccharomyces pombe]